MSDAATRRGVFAVVAVGVVAIVCLLLGHRAIQGYVDDHPATRASAPDMPNSAGVAGVVTFADGSPAPSARIDITWRDSAGRLGETPAMTDERGRFAQPKFPAHAKVERIAASIGPLEAEADDTGPAPGETTGSRARIVLPATFRLAGLVRNAGDRAPVAGAKLEFAGVVATSGSDGDFKMEAVPASALRDARPIVRVVADGHKTLEWPLPKDSPPESYGDLTIMLEPAK
jgi:hypothetical protein